VYVMLSVSMFYGLVAFGSSGCDNGWGDIGVFLVLCERQWYDGIMLWLCSASGIVWGATMIR